MSAMFLPAVRADVRLPRSIGDHMVLRQERPLPTNADVEAVVAERVTALLESRQRQRSKLHIERSQRFVPPGRSLAENEDESAIDMSIREMCLLFGPRCRYRIRRDGCVPRLMRRPNRKTGAAEAAACNGFRSASRWLGEGSLATRCADSSPGRPAEPGCFPREPLRPRRADRQPADVRPRQGEYGSGAVGRS